jgi:phosphoenolpyruvate-protein kinase (PTS system EI component)
MEEWRAARRLLDQVIEEVRSSGTAVPSAIETGIMVEVPAAALCAGKFAPEVDFFSIGTNDLTQYTLAAERGNAQVAHLADSLDPSLLELIRLVVRAAHGQNKWVGVCGEMAGDPVAIPLLIGFGIDELSMNPASIPLAKKTVRGLDYSAACAIARRALDLESADQIRAYLRQTLSI